MLPTPAEVRKQTKELAAENQTSPEYLNLVCEIYAAEYEMEQKLTLGAIYAPVRAEDFEKRLKSGLPAIEPEKIKIDEEALTAFLETIGFILAKHAPEAGAIAARLLAEQKAGRINLLKLLRAFAAGDGVLFTGDESPADGDTAGHRFIVSILARPVLRRLAQEIGSKNRFADFSGDDCPVCGGTPLMAKILRDDGKRMVECSRCETEWVARRIRCLACGNEEDTSLGYIYVEGEPCRIDKCDKCHTYLKTLDERRIAVEKERLLRIEDAATVYLDMLAEKKGYHSLNDLG